MIYTEKKIICVLMKIVSTQKGLNWGFFAELISSIQAQDIDHVDTIDTDTTKLSIQPLNNKHPK